MDDGSIQLTFAQLYAAVQQHADTLNQCHAPATVFVNDQLSTIDQMVSFMGIISTGRCAAVSDPDWPSAVRTHVQNVFPRPPARFTLVLHPAAQACPKAFAVTTNRGPRACVFA